MNLKQLSARSGFSLVEMMIAIVVAGLMLAIATPKVRATVIRQEVHAARAAVANMYARARIHALQSRKPTTVHFNGTQTWVTATDGAVLDTVGAVVDLTSLYGVSVAASQAQIGFTPTGFTSIGSAKVVVARSGYRDSVQVTGYGRLK